MGEANTTTISNTILLLPLDERQVEIWDAPNWRDTARLIASARPVVSRSDPARSKIVPPDQQTFLKAYESRDRMINFLNHINSLGCRLSPAFEIRQLPEAIQADQPRWFHESARLYDRIQPLLFHPNLQSPSKNFYIRAAIEDPRPILVTKEFRTFSSKLDRKSFDE